MLEVLSTRRVNITGLSLEQPHTRRPLPFDISSVMTSENSELIYKQLFYFQGRNFVGEFGWEDFDRTSVSASILLPAALDKLKSSRSLFQRMKEGEDVRAAHHPQSRADYAK